jgi:hypothetical protein
MLLLGATIAACAPSPEVRTPFRAVEVAQATLREAGIREHAVASSKRGGSWVVITRSEKNARMGHVVTVDAATGKVSVERYHSVQLGRDRR